MIFDEMKSPLWPLLASVKRPGRYSGGEWGAFVKSAPRGGADFARICLAFPDVYEVGMSYLGYQILYSLVKTLDYADVERVYCPWPDMESAMREAGLPLGSLESGRPLSGFDAVGFTLQYELCSTNILTMLDLGGVPLLAAERGNSDPVVIGGGGGACAPAPLEMFFDAFCVGDGEVIMPELMRVLSGLRGRGRDERLEGLSRVGGVYVPGVSSGRTRIAGSRGLDDDFVHRTMVVPNCGIIHDRVAVQVFRGCTSGCRFCQAGMIGRPRRERSAGSVASQVRELLRVTGWEEVGLLSLATCEWSGLGELIDTMSDVFEKDKIKLSLPSLRMDSFSVELAARLGGVRHGGLTFAPEAGSARLRRVINKGVTDDDINSTLDAVFRHGWERVKLYFMMGLPTETETDLDGIADIAGRAVHFARLNKRRGEVSVSVAGFVPKAHTPFQWEPQVSRDSLRERGRYIKGRARGRKISISYHEPDQTFLEGIFARGDKSMGPVILEAWKRGARFDGWTERFDMRLWEDTFRDLGADPASYACRPRDLDEALPWDMIDVGISRDFLMSERARAMDETPTPDCSKGCNGCGWQTGFSKCSEAYAESVVR